MIIEVAIVAVAMTSIFGSALAFADRVLKRQAQEHPSPIAERRRILERKRPRTSKQPTMPPMLPFIDRTIF